MLDLFGPASAAGSVTSRPADDRTFGTADTFFADCTSPVADDGTEFRAAWFNALMANARALARGNGTVVADGSDVVTQNNADDNMLLKAVQYLIQRGQSNAALDTGTVGHVVATFAPAVREHKLLQRFYVKIANTNTGATDFAPNGLSAVPITRLGGAALQPGDLMAAGIAELAFDGTNYQIISHLGPGNASTTKAPKLIGFVANQTGSGGTNVPTSVATQLSFTNVQKNNLYGTSTYDGANLTVGAGEAGIWNVNAACHIPIESTAGFEQIAIYQNGVQVFTGTTSVSQAATGSYVEVSANIVCNAGDVLKIYLYHQFGYTINSAADNTTNFSAFLISAY